MAFEELPKRRGRGLPLGDRASVLVCSNGKRFTFRIAMGADLADKLGWSFGTYVTVLVGRGKDGGLLKLVLSPAGRKLQQLGARRTAIHMQFSWPPEWGDGALHPSEIVDHKIDDEGLTLTMPEWYPREAKAA